MKTSIRDIVRRERWAANATELQQQLDADLAAMILSGDAPFGWVLVMEEHFQKTREHSELLRKALTP